MITAIQYDCQVWCASPVHSNAQILQMILKRDSALIVVGICIGRLVRF